MLQHSEGKGEYSVDTNGCEHKQTKCWNPPERAGSWRIGGQVTWTVTSVCTEAAQSGGEGRGGSWVGPNNVRTVWAADGAQTPNSATTTAVSETRMM